MCSSCNKACLEAVTYISPVVTTKNLAELGTRKYPRFGFYIRDDAPSHVTEANEELIEKWATYCHREAEGHKRAVMVSDQAATLAKALADGRGLHSTERAPALYDSEGGGDGDTWRQEDYAASDLPEEEQLQLRLAKGIAHAQSALSKCHAEGELTKHTQKLLKQMAPVAGRKLTRLHAGDYAAQVRSHACLGQVMQLN